MFIFHNKNTKVFNCLSDHRDDVVNCYGKFEEFFKVLFDTENKELSVLQSLKVAVDNYEEAADRELRHAVDLMSESFLPSTRTELIALVKSTDEIANQCQEIVRQVLLEKVQIPNIIHADVLDIISITKVQLDILYKAFDKFINDYKDIFKNRMILDDIRSEESKVDNIEQMLYANIFGLDMSLCEKVYHRTLVADICQISDIIEDISDQIQVMLVERES